MVPRYLLLVGNERMGLAGCVVTLLHSGAGSFSTERRLAPRLSDLHSDLGWESWGGLGI
jgi:hypothetical protein